MISPTLSRLGYCAQLGDAMLPVDPAYLFEMGDAARGLRRLSVGADRVEQWVALNTARSVIHSCVYESIYAQNFRVPLVTAAHEVIRLCDSLQQKIFPNEEGAEGQAILPWEVSQIQAAYIKFETIFISELQSLTSYLVAKKSGFDTATMVFAGSSFFSAELKLKVPAALPDLDQAMKCIAFEVPTAAGFHLHRANEIVLRAYWDSVTGKAPPPKERNMGRYLDELNKKEAGNPSVRAHLKSIKDFHRNPMMHPEQSLESVDQAIDLMSAIRCAIGYMLKEIPMPTPANAPSMPIPLPSATILSDE